MNYNKYSKYVKDYMMAVETYLISKYGKVNDEWGSSLFMLAENLELYIECKKSIKANGIYNVESGRKNPLLSTIKDLQATIIKQIQHLGLSPYASSKIKQEVEDDTENFVDSLTNE